MESKFTDGSTGGFIELPLKPAWLTWTRGEAKLASIKDADPGAYFGGWKAFVSGKDRVSGEEYENPKLPLPVVQRVSEDGKHPYKVYATNIISFLPIQHRTRFELRETVKDEATGREYQKLVALAQGRRQGYAPCRQIFGMVLSADGKTYAPGILLINKWSAFITFEKAGQKWNKIKVPEGEALIRRYGTSGDKDGMPNFEVFGQSRSTPIEAIDIANPKFIKVTPELEKLYEDSVAWKNCERWNAEGKEDEPEDSPILSKFMAACEEMGLTNIEIEQLIKENNGDYAKALKSISGEFTEDDVNTALSAEEV